MVQSRLVVHILWFLVLLVLNLVLRLVLCSFWQMPPLWPCIYLVFVKPYWLILVKMVNYCHPIRQLSFQVDNGMSTAMGRQYYFWLESYVSSDRTYMRRQHFLSFFVSLEQYCHPLSIFSLRNHMISLSPIQFIIQQPIRHKIMVSTVDSTQLLLTQT